MSENSVVIGYSWAFTDALNALEVDWRLAAVSQDSGCFHGDDPWIDDSFSASQAAETFETMVDMWLMAGTYGPPSPGPTSSPG